MLHFNYFNPILKQYFFSAKAEPWLTNIDSGRLLVETKLGQEGVGRSFALQLKVSVMSETIEVVRYRASGCVVTIALGAWLADYLVGKRIDDSSVSDLVSTVMMKELSAPSSHYQAALLLEDALQQCLSQFTIKSTHIG